MTIASPVRGRARTVRWIVLAAVAVLAAAGLTAWLTAPATGGRLDPESTAGDGAHALVALLRDRGVDVIVAGSLDDAARAARPDRLLVLVQTFHLAGDEQLRRLATLPGDRLLVEPSGRTRESLAPALRREDLTAYGGLTPGCDLRAAEQAGTVQFDTADTYAAAGSKPVTRCYDGVLTRYADGDRTVTVVGGGRFLENSGLLEEGNAALAMNLVGSRPAVVWYAPQQSEGDQRAGDTTVSALLPPQVFWLVVQLAVAVLLIAAWQARRVGPLVTERLPVVVRASETVEGRARLYRSHRARDRAAEALRDAARRRLLPRLGLGPGAPPETVAAAVAARCGTAATTVAPILYGEPPGTDADLVALARALDDIERQVAQS
jgi:hypothetical protein